MVALVMTKLMTTIAPAHLGLLEETVRIYLIFAPRLHVKTEPLAMMMLMTIHAIVPHFILGKIVKFLEAI